VHSGLHHRRSRGHPRASAEGRRHL
jgi:hypothetical protein